MTARLTQKQRLLDLLRERGGRGVMVYEIIAPQPDGLGISQYNARILELRRVGNKIINKKPGHFVLVEEEDEDDGEGYQPQYVFEPGHRKNIYRAVDPITKEQLGFTL